MPILAKTRGCVRFAFGFAIDKGAIDRHGNLTIAEMRQFYRGRFNQAWKK
jgi:hypothetical protein